MWLVATLLGRTDARVLALPQGVLRERWPHCCCARASLPPSPPLRTLPVSHRNAATVPETPSLILGSTELSSFRSTLECIRTLECSRQAPSPNEIKPKKGMH